MLLLIDTYTAAVPRSSIWTQQAQSLPLNLGASKHGQMQVTRLSNLSSQMHTSSKLGEK